MDIHNRFKELIWYKKSKDLPVIVVGVGGIGSWLTMGLSRIGCEITVFDDDVLEEHNQGGQFYSHSVMNTPKVEALQSIIKDFSNVYIHYKKEKFTEESSVAPVMFSAVDNMAARKTIFNRWCELVIALKDQPEELKNCLFIDGRMLAENLQIYTVTPSEIEQYKTTLFEDTEVQEQPCSAKATSHCGMLIGSLMTSIFTNWLTNLIVDIKVVPFCTTFDIPLLELNDVPLKEFENE